MERYILRNKKKDLVKIYEQTIFPLIPNKEKIIDNIRELPLDFFFLSVFEPFKINNPTMVSFLISGGRKNKIWRKVRNAGYRILERYCKKQEIVYEGSLHNIYILSENKVLREKFGINRRRRGYNRFLILHDFMLLGLLTEIAYSLRSKKEFYFLYSPENVRIDGEFINYDLLLLKTPLYYNKEVERKMIFVEFQRKWKTEKKEKKEKVINRTPVITVISKEGVRVNPIFNEILVGMKGFRHLEIDELMEVKKIKLVRNTLPFVVSRFW